MADHGRHDAAPAPDIGVGELRGRVLRTATTPGAVAARTPWGDHPLRHGAIIRTGPAVPAA